MKNEKYYLVLAIAASFLCVPALGEMELPLDSYEPFLIARPNPALTAIEKLYVVIVPPDSEPNEDAPTWKELESKVQQKLEAAGINTSQIRDGRRDFDVPELTVEIDIFKLQDSHLRIFRIQTSLARAVYLVRDSSWLIKADVWKTKPKMQAAAVQDMPAVVTNCVLQQAEAFIGAYRVANRQPGQSPDANDISNVSVVTPKESPEPSSKQLAVKYEYVASKSSKAFHRPDCRWAREISLTNLEGYNSREQAIQAGKRPCRWCKP